MEQLEEDCEAVILIVCIHPEGPCFFSFSGNIFFFVLKFVSFVREGMGMIGESFCISCRGRK